MSLAFLALEICTVCGRVGKNVKAEGWKQRWKQLRDRKNSNITMNSADCERQ